MQKNKNKNKNENISIAIYSHFSLRKKSPISSPKKKF
jgi:hypothetical protein